MPLTLRIPCPYCGEILRRKPAGRCPQCGGPVTAHVAEAREREERIEKVVAVVGTFLVLLIFLLTSGLGLLEGVVGYALAGVVVWVFARQTFRPNQKGIERSEDRGSS
jgi:hypothetical protein